MSGTSPGEHRLKDRPLGLVNLDTFAFTRSSHQRASERADTRTVRADPTGAPTDPRNNLRPPRVLADGGAAISANPYAPPARAIALTVPSRPDVRRMALRSLTWLGGSLGMLVATVLILFAATPRLVPMDVITLGLSLSALGALVGFVKGLLAIAAAARAPAPRVRVALLPAVATLVNLVFFAFGAFSAFLSTVVFSRGRQLRRLGRVLLPPLASGAGWAPRKAHLDQVDDEMRAALAARWRENARTEHASVAAFARLTLDLVALGAPPELLAAAQRDAADEIAHAEACFAIARSIDGAETGPGPFRAAALTGSRSRVRIVALAELAVDSLVDGALHEGLSARVVAKLARRCEVSAIREVLLTIAADEGRHSAHGWDVVEWCVREGGEAVVSALEGAVRALPATVQDAMPREAMGGGWEKWGIPGRATEAEEYARARENVATRLRAMAIGIRGARAAT